MYPIIPSFRLVVLSYFCMATPWDDVDFPLSRPRWTSFPFSPAFYDQTRTLFFATGPPMIPNFGRSLYRGFFRPWSVSAPASCCSFSQEDGATVPFPSWGDDAFFSPMQFPQSFDKQTRCETPPARRTKLNLFIFPPARPLNCWPFTSCGITIILALLCNLY